MAGDSREATVAALVHDGILFVEDGNHGEYRPLAEEFAEVGTPFVRPDDLRDGRVDFTNCDHINDQALNRVRKGKGRAGDIVFTHRATVGRIARSGRDAPNFVANPGVTIWRSTAPEVLDPDYLYFFMQDPTFMNQVWAEAGNTDTFPYVSLTQQRRLKVSFPGIEQQRAIAHILGTLDDKIELNRRMSETLEAMARALFKSWFVDFDPVRAKAEGRDAGLPKPLADLFADRLVDSEVGEIPEGWFARTVEGVCSTVTRGVTPRYEEGSRRYIINQRANRGARLDLAELKELAPTLDVPADCYAKRWDVLINCLGEGTLGRVHLFKGKSDTYAVDQHMSICRGITSGAGAYLYQVLASPVGQEKIESLKTGSTGMTMFNISKLRGFDILWPGDALIAAYFRITEPALTRTTNSEEQSQTLAALRDALLPKLISGEVRVKDAEKFVARAV